MFNSLFCGAPKYGDLKGFPGLDIEQELYSGCLVLAQHLLVAI
jgi:hypothetical protein